MNDFVPRLRSTVYPSRRRAVMRQGRLMRPRNALETLMWGKPPGPLPKRRASYQPAGRTA